MDNKDKMAQVRDATNLVFGLLNENDYLSIVTFDTDARVVMEATRWGDVNRNDAEEKVERMQPRGGTDIYAGLESAKATLAGLGDDEDVAKRILLLSDGRDTDRRAPDFEPLARDVADRGISIYSAGIGIDYDPDTIRVLGEQSQGKWTHVETPADIRSFFGDVVQEASTVVANNPELVVEPVQGVEVAEVYRREPQVQEVDLEYDDDDHVVVGLPDLQSAEEQRIVMKLDVPGADVGETRKVASVGLEAGGRSTSTDIAVNYTDDPEELAVQHDDVYLAHRDTVIRSELARADGDDDLEDVEDLIDETEIVAGDAEVADDLRDAVTKIEQGDESQTRKIQEQTTIIHDDERFE
jgi:Ca-activated chloride channel family protein